MSNYDVYAMGNALVDLEYKVTDDFFTKNNIEKGLMTLIDENRHGELLNILGESMIKKSCGGSAANTIIALSQFGGKGYYSCKVAQDDFGEFYIKDLKSNGVDTSVHLEEGVTGKCIVMTTPDADRTMNTYLGITSEYSVAELNEEALKDSKWLYIEGYLITSANGRKAMHEAIKIARKNNVKISLTLSDPGIVAGFRDYFFELLVDNIDLIFCNEAEAREMTQQDDFKKAREDMKNFADRFVITLGKNGAMVFDGDTYVDIEPYEVEAVDSNGAGDMFAGTFLYGINHGHTYAGSAKLASLACSHLVVSMGPRLEPGQMQKILKKFNS